MIGRIVWPAAAIAIVAALAALGAYHVWQVGQAYDSGFRAARLECAEAQAEAAAKREAERRADQGKIAEIERRLLAEQDRQRVLQQMAEVNRAIEEDKADELASASKTPGACYSGVSRRLRDVIDKAGR